MSAESKKDLMPEADAEVKSGGTKKLLQDLASRSSKTLFQFVQLAHKMLAEDGVPAGLAAFEKLDQLCARALSTSTREKLWKYLDPCREAGMTLTLSACLAALAADSVALIKDLDAVSKRVDSNDMGCSASNIAQVSMAALRVLKV